MDLAISEQLHLRNNFKSEQFGYTQSCFTRSVCHKIQELSTARVCDAAVLRIEEYMVAQFLVYLILWR